jgi:hypothetical protein
MNTNAGHRIPTGETFRNILLLVEASDEKGEPLKQVSGGKVPEWGGTGPRAEGYYAGLPGKGFALVYADAQGNINVPFWKAVRVISDNRIRPRNTDESVYAFERPKGKGPAEVRVTARLIYRKTFKPLADAKGWKLEDIVMEEASEVLYVE